MNAADGSIFFPWALNAFALALLYLCAFRPLLRLVGGIEASSRRRRLPAGPVGGAQPEPSSLPQADLPPAEASPERRAIEEARRAYEEVCAFAAANPERTTEILRAWMKERA